MRTFFIFLFFLNSLYLYSTPTESYVLCYGIKEEGILEKTWAYKDQKDSYYRIKGDWLYSPSDKTVALIVPEKEYQTLESICHLSLKNSIPLKSISFMAGASIFSSHYPVIQRPQLSFLDLKKALSFQEMLDYEELISYANASLYVYYVLTSKEWGELSKSQYNHYKNYLPTIMPKGYTVIQESINDFYSIRSIAFYNKTKNQVIVSYRGSSNHLGEFDKENLISDFFILISNFLKTPNYLNIIKNSKSFYLEIKKKYPTAQFILTGHSLGGYLASMIAYEEGEIARVFSSPATYKTAGLLSLFYSHQYTMKNAINFLRDNDYPVLWTGRHMTQTVYFQGHPTFNFTKRHSIVEFIDEVLIKKQIPSDFDIKPDTYIGFGIKKIPVK